MLGLNAPSASSSGLTCRRVPSSRGRESTLGPRVEARRCSPSKGAPVNTADRDLSTLFPTITQHQGRHRALPHHVRPWIPAGHLGRHRPQTSRRRRRPVHLLGHRPPRASAPLVAAPLRLRPHWGLHRHSGRPDVNRRSAVRRPPGVPRHRHGRRRRVPPGRRRRRSRMGRLGPVPVHRAPVATRRVYHSGFESGTWRPAAGGVNRLTRLPSGSRSSSERLPHGMVVGGCVTVTAGTAGRMRS